MMVDAPAANYQGYHTISSVSWNDNTTIIGANGKADHGGTYFDPYWKHDVHVYNDDDTTDEYDITDAVHNNGTVTLTNIGTDQNGRAVDIQLTFTNTDNVQRHGPALPSKVFIGRAPDDSIEVNSYGGFWNNPDGSPANQGINISNIAFVYHGTNTKIPVFLNSLFADIDFGQQFKTNFGNVLSWSASDSQVSISGNHFVDTSKDGREGFKSAPQGTALAVGAGTDFNYWFWGPDDLKPADMSYEPTTKEEGGVQFNLFGKGASLASTPLPPIQQTASANYHYDVTLAKRVIPCLASVWHPGF